MATLGALAIGAFGSEATRHAAGVGGPACPFLFATGLPCPFCGMTRGTIAMGHGDFREALAYHPLAPLVLVLILSICTLVVLGRTAWLRRHVWWIAGAVGAIWIARFVIAAVAR